MNTTSFFPKAVCTDSQGKEYKNNFKVVLATSYPEDGHEVDIDGIVEWIEKEISGLQLTYYEATLKLYNRLANEYHDYDTVYVSTMVHEKRTKKCRYLYEISNHDVRVQRVI